MIIDFGQLGDVVLSLPALAALRDKFSDRRLTVMSGKIAGQVVELARLADEVIAIDRVQLRDGPKVRSIAGVFRILRDVRLRRFDLVIDLHSLPETNILAFLSGARWRLLANRESRSLDRLSNFRPAPPPEDKTKPLNERYLDVLRPLGITDAPELFTFSTESAANAPKQVVGLFPGAGHPSRCWPLERFAELAQLLSERGIATVVYLGPEEEGMANAVSSAFPQTTRVVQGLSISQFIAATAKLDAFVTNDTGPMHLAACAGAAIVLVLDGRAPLTYLPLTKRLSVVQGETIGSIPTAEVLTALERFLRPTASK